MLFETELPRGFADEDARSAFEGVSEGSASEGPLAALFRILADHETLEDLQVALPGDEDRRCALAAFREAAPLRVNEILARRRSSAPGVHKVGGDLIVPFEALGEMLEIYERGFRGRGLEFAVWGHLSDGNLHPNALPGLLLLS